MSKKIPLWILTVSALFALMEIFVGVALFVMPEQVFEQVDFSGEGTYFLAKSWATRQFALGVLLAVAVLKKSRALLRASYIFLFVMFLGDMAVGISLHENAAIVSGIIMALISACLLFFVQKPLKN